MKNMTAFVVPLRFVSSPFIDALFGFQENGWSATESKYYICASSFLMRYSLTEDKRISVD